MNKFIVIGGGAAGIFAAIWAKQTNPLLEVILLEKTSSLLSKVRISGGGRCNVTHSCFDPKELSLNYPRGGNELIGPFHRFQPKDTIHWFQSRGITLKTEKDGRIFPTTDSSETIIQCLLGEASRLGVTIEQKKRIEAIERSSSGFCIKLNEESPIECHALLLATGGHPTGHGWAKALGHTISDPVPSLFTFNVPTSPLKSLSGIALPDAELGFETIPCRQRGALLITHFGFSGPAAIKLSAWAARPLHQASYKARLWINWLPKYTLKKIQENLLQLKQSHPKDSLLTLNPFSFPKNFWKEFLGDDLSKRMSDIPHKKLNLLAEKIHKDSFQVEGKTTHKEEFVTCGGILLKEIDFHTMESKICLGLYFAGEVLDIDGVTGGFNFQNAWTTGFIAGTAVGNRLNPQLSP